MLKVRDGTYFKTYRQGTVIDFYERRHGAPLFKNYYYSVVDLSSGKLLECFEVGLKAEVIGS